MREASKSDPATSRRIHPIVKYALILFLAILGAKLLLEWTLIARGVQLAAHSRTLRPPTLSLNQTGYAQLNRYLSLGQFARDLARALRQGGLTEFADYVEHDPHQVRGSATFSRISFGCPLMSKSVFEFKRLRIRDDFDDPEFAQKNAKSHEIALQVINDQIALIKSQNIDR